MDLSSYQQLILGDAVVFWTASWCGPCKSMYGFFDEIKKKYVDKNITFLKLDVEEYEEISRYEDIMAMPTFIFYKDGIQIGRLQGANKNEFLKHMDRMVSTSD